MIEQRTKHTSQSATISNERIVKQNCIKIMSALPISRIYIIGKKRPLEKILPELTVSGG
jgi:hypothetical protein